MTRFWSRSAAVAIGCALACAAPSLAQAATTGDFDGDGHSDLAVGAPADSVRGQPSAGAVNIIYGSAGDGLRSAGDQQFTQDTPGVRGRADAHDRFGATLATGDFDADGYGDLVVGAPAEDVSGVEAAGVAQVFYGGPSGLTVRDRLFGQGFEGIAGTREPEQNFGSALVAGDFDGDGHDDVAIGVRDESVGGAAGAGAVNVLYGSGRGLQAARNRIWTQNSRGIKGVAGRIHHFGAALAAGDLDADGRDDLAIGVPGGRIAGASAAGAVSVLYGSASGVSARDQLWSQGARGIKGAAEAHDRFGWSVAMGDFDQDGDDDLAVGAPLEDLSGAANAGAVSVLYSVPGGLGSADEMVHQADRGIKGAPEEGDRFGTTLAVRDFERDFEDDLAIGVPFEDLDGRFDAGAVAVVYGSEDSGIHARDDFWHQRAGGIAGQLESFDDFGSALAVGDFDGDRRGDLAVGVPRDSVGAFPNAGAVNVLYGASGGLQTVDAQLWTQGTAGIGGAVGDDRFGARLASGTPAG